jgi:hypothetical protein
MAPMFLGYVPSYDCPGDTRGHFPEKHGTRQEGACHFCGGYIYRNGERKRWFSLETRFVIQEEPW